MSARVAQFLKKFMEIMLNKIIILTSHALSNGSVRIRILHIIEKDHTIRLVKDCGVGNLEFKTAVFRNVNSGYKVSSYLIFVCSIILPK